MQWHGCTFCITCPLEGNPPVTVGIPSQRTGNMELWCFLWCYWTTWWTSGWVAKDFIEFIMLMWYHYKGYGVSVMSILKIDGVATGLRCTMFHEMSIIAMYKLAVMYSQCSQVIINTLRSRQNGRHFTDDIFECIFLNANVWTVIEISLKFIAKGPINNIPALVQIMAWRRPGNKPLSEALMGRLLTHICIARPQWVKAHDNENSEPSRTSAGRSMI